MEKFITSMFLGILLFSNVFSQTYTYASSPAIGTYVACPSDCNDWLGGVLQMKLISADATSFTFRIHKCDGSAFTTSGTATVGWDTDLQCSGNPPTGGVESVSVTAGSYYKDITVPASWFFNGNNSYWVGAYSNGTNTYYAGMVTVTRTLAAPSTPTGLSANATSTSGISLTWNSVSSATSYDVYDCGGSYITNTSNTSYSVSGLSAGTYYSYKVRAKNSGGTSSFTSCTGATTNSNTLSISPTSTQNVSSTAGSGSVSVNSNTNWTSSSNQTWLTITSGSSGSGSGTVSYSYSANSGTSSRTATITISASGVASQTLTVVQAGASLYLTISPSTTQNVSSGAGSGNIIVSSNTSWSASSDQTWLTITSGSSGSGNGTVSYSYSANSGTSSRTATITLSASGVSSQTLTVVQEGASLYLTISPTATQNVSSSAGTGNVTVSSNVSWTATSNQSWLSITAGSNGSGNGTVSYSYSANTGTSSRSATITLSASGVSSQTLTFVQAGASLYLTISPSTAQNVSSGTGSGNIIVSSNTSWSASSNQSWLTITSGSNGNGSGTVSYSYSENPNTFSRSAIITLSASGVSSQTLTVVQAGVPIYLVISPDGTIDLSENSGSGSIQVSSNTDWDAISNQSWLTITSGISGTGNASIYYSYTTNSSASVRTATITVSATGLSSKTLTLNQQGITQSDLCIVPKLLVPKDQATDIATQTHFIWEKVPGANVSYNLEVYNSSDVLVYSKSGINSTDYRLLPSEALERGSVNYKYRVQANVDGQLTEWSEMRSFNTLLSNNSNLWSVGVAIGHFLDVIIYSNSGYPLSDYSCNFGDDCSYVSGICTGLKWQCVEYALRFYWQIYRLNLHAHGLNGNANYFDNNASLAGLRFVSKNSPKLPKVGDILVWDDGYGHVAIVMSVNYDDVGNYSLTVAQQNVSAGQFIDFEMQVEQDNYSHKVIYGSKDYAGFLTPQPVFASTNPQDGGVITTTTPTIAWEYLPQGGFTIYIKEMDDNGCYQTYHTYSGYGQSFYVNQSIALTPGKNYLYRVVNNLPSGQYQNPVVYFSVAETKSSSSEEILAEKLTVRVVDENNSPVSDVSIYSETLNGIEYRGTTGSAGLCNLSTFEKINSSDLIVCKSAAYDDVERIVENADLESGFITITLNINESYNSLFGAKVLAFQHGTENYNQIFTEPEVELVITAEMHNAYSICVPDYYVENVENCTEHQVQDSVISLTLLPGANNFRVHFYTEEDTLTIEKTLFYYPESFLDEYSQKVTIVSTPALAETLLLVDGNFFDVLSGESDVFDLTNGVHDLVFLKDGFYEYVRVYSDTTIVLDYNPAQTNQLNKGNINLFPNPINSKITIQNAEGSFAEVFDSAGRIVYSCKIESDNFVTDLSHLENGIYLIRFSKSNTFSYNRFVKM